MAYVIAMKIQDKSGRLLKYDLITNLANVLLRD